MTNLSPLVETVYYIFGVSGAIFLVLGLYLCFYKVKDMDRILYGSGHPAHLVFKAGGVFYANLRVGGDYGTFFWLILICPNRFDKSYPNNISLSQVPLIKRIPYMAYAAAGMIFLLAGGSLYFIE